MDKKWGFRWISREPLNRFVTNSHGRRLVPRSDEFQGQGHQGQKRHFLALSAACVRFMFLKTSSACSYDTFEPSNVECVILKALLILLSAIT